jgi:hypothetical protein
MEGWKISLISVGLFAVVVTVTLVLLFFLLPHPAKEHALSKNAACFPHNIYEEWGERRVARAFTGVPYCSSVIEFGGGAGSVSAVVQERLRNPNNHVVIQPTLNEMFGGIAALRETQAACSAQFKIIDHVLEPGEGDSVLQMFDDTPNCIVADCEGCLHGEYEKNPQLFANIQTIQVERDDVDGAYDQLFEALDMELIHEGLGCNGKCTTQVWRRTLE